MRPNMLYVTYLMFADDTLLLGQATIEEVRSFKRILSIYKKWSGQLISVQKSTLLFSPNVDGAIRIGISVLQILCKQAWKLFTEPTSYPSKVLKTRISLRENSGQRARNQAIHGGVLSV
ncbi:hypothetical protein LIER_00541 [Lithospermum erythrorhizon]|uniref:Reverse transcriptase n=1 Tax=Lithospermum erythrorhizon TaxID=34254 RepID=A0AAV3NIU7_LITER